MGLRLFSFLLVISFLGAKPAAADWIFGRASTAKKAKDKMIGMSKEKVLECMGAPAQKEKVGGTEVWSYHAGGDTTKVGVAAAAGRTGVYVGGSKDHHRYCDVNVIMKKDRVQRINYNGRTGGLFTGGEQCAYAVENCID